MNRRLRLGRLSSLLCFFLFILSPGIGHGDDEEFLKHPREMTFPPLAFSLPQAQRTVLANGMVLYMREDSELPLITLSLSIRTGSMYDPPQQSGLAAVVAKVWRNGGTLGQTSQEINEILEFMAADLEFSMGRESGSIFLSVRKKDFSQALAILVSLLRGPAFDPIQLDLAKKQEIEAIRRSNDDPQEIAFREFRQALYGGNPRGRVPTIESISSLQQNDLFAFYRKFFHPHNLLLGISGDFKAEEMKTWLEEAFRGWEQSLVEVPFIPIPLPRDKKSMVHAEKDLPQSMILLGHLTVPRNHPDHVPFKILNFILGGGGFNSRLTQEIRSNQGLAYSVGSFYQGRVGYGVFGAYGQTKSSTTGKVISLFYEIIEDLKKNNAKPGELDWAKNSLMNQFIFSFTSSASIVSQQMDIEYDGLPPDYLQTYSKKVKAVTLEDLGRATQNLHPEKSLLLVVGKEKDFDQPLSSFGVVNRLELKKYE